MRNGVVKLTRPLTEIKVPPTVQAVLASRIDRLPADEKDLLQTLAVIGREFGVQLIHRVGGRSEAELERMLLSLQSGEFIYEQPAFPDTEYIFKHALTQEVASNSVLLERRKLLHGRAGQALESMFAEQLDDHLGELAHHYSRSGNTQKAIEYLHLAGQQAVQRSANAEAIGHFTAALELLKTLPDTPERTQQELTLQLTLGPVLMNSKGWAAPEVEKAYARARELCQQAGENAHLFPVLWGLWTFYLVQGALHKAHELGERGAQAYGLA